MIKRLTKNLKGDKTIWVIILMMAMYSFVPVYSASTNLVYVVGSGSTWGYMSKHFGILTMGLVLMFMTHKLPYRFYKGIIKVAMPVLIIVLAITLFQGKTIGGANASRWINIPFTGITIQTSAFAFVVVMTYVARYLARRKDREFDFKEDLLWLWSPLFLVVALILPANFSTAFILSFLVGILLLIGGYPIKSLAKILVSALLAFTFYILVVKAFPNLMSNRVDTWISRVEHFSSNDVAEGYQIQKAKIAIATGGLLGRGPGKSVQKNFLPQSSSDFIYAIIIEENGLMFGVIIIFFYLVLLIRFHIVAKKSGTVFGSLLVTGLGMTIIFQAFINMAVATNLLPVTGQVLPFVSSGGSAFWAACVAVGMILSVSAEKDFSENEFEETTDNPLEILHKTIDGE